MIERARNGLRERERRRGGPREREERSLEGVLPRKGGVRERGGDRYRGRAPPRLLQPLSLVLLSSFPNPPLPLLPRPRPLPPPRSDLSDRSRSRMSSSRILRSRSVRARVSPSWARRISSFFSSTKLRGMPAGEACASISKFQRATMNAGVESVRKPVRLICIFLGSGVGWDLSSRRPMAYSIRTSSSKPTSSTTFLATQGRMTCKFTLRISTFVSN